MPAKNLIRFNVGGRDPLTLFGVKVSSSFTIPRSKTVTSPTDDAKLSSIVDVVGGQLLAAMNDGAAGTACTFDVTREAVCDLYPGDVVAMSAVVSNVATVTVTSVDGTVRTFKITGVTTTATILGYYA